MKKFLFLLVITIASWMLLSGCERDPIVEKLVHGQALTEEETKKYAKDEKTKLAYDAIAATRKKEIEEKSYKPFSAEEATQGKRQYKARNGNTYEFDITPKACNEFGFSAGDYVKAINDNAHVVGVHEGNLWFHDDTDSGATYRSGWTKKDFDNKGFQVIKPYSGLVAAPSPIINTETQSAEEPSSNQDAGGTQAVSAEGNSAEFDAYFKPIPRIPFKAKK